MPINMIKFPFFKKRFYLFIFRERKGVRKRGRETPDSHAFITGDLAHNPGMCLDWESNL